MDPPPIKSDALIDSRDIIPPRPSPRPEKSRSRLHRRANARCRESRWCRSRAEGPWGRTLTTPPTPPLGDAADSTDVDGDDTALVGDRSDGDDGGGRCRLLLDEPVAMPSSCPGSLCSPLSPPGVNAEDNGADSDDVDVDGGDNVSSGTKGRLRRRIRVTRWIRRSCRCPRARCTTTGWADRF